MPRYRRIWRHPAARRETAPCPSLACLILSPRVGDRVATRFMGRDIRTLTYTPQASFR